MQVSNPFATPDYRSGAAPLQWAVIDGETETGISIMQLDEGMDTGPVLFENRIAIDPEWTSGDLFEHLKDFAPGALLAALMTIELGRAVAKPQDHAQATHARMLTKADGAIDFREPAAKVASRIRGVDPWPAAFTLLDWLPFPLWHPKLARDRKTAAQGTVLAASPEGFTGACGQGAVVFGEAQLPGRKRLPVGTLLVGHAISVGTVLGQ